MAKNIAITANSSMSVCIKKFQNYATPRGITLLPETYGFYEVRKGNSKSIRGAVKAIKADGTSGWVINWADKERKFFADADKSVAVSKKKHSLEESVRLRQAKKPAAVEVEEDL
ncbi:MAG: hypothetical protein NC218_07125 [Acetobacter sp.]|nr:hypothetical protein [Acetobacter sp.]